MLSVLQVLPPSVERAALPQSLEFKLPSQLVNGAIGVMNVPSLSSITGADASVDSQGDLITLNSLQVLPPFFE